MTTNSKIYVISSTVILNNAVEFLTKYWHKYSQENTRLNPLVIRERFKRSTIMLVDFMKKEQTRQTRQEKYLAKLIRRNGIYFNPADPADVERLAKFDSLPNKTEAIKKWLDSLDS